MNVFYIPMMALMIPIIIVPISLGIKHARYLREVEHAERMRAMELGQTLAEDQSWTPASVALTIGGGVPIGAMFIAYIAAPKQGGSDAVWIAAALIGVAGVICGTLLASQLFAKQSQNHNTAYSQKPAFDPEAFEPVGHRD